MVRELAGLKARLFWNGIRADRQRRIGLPLITALVAWLAWSLATGHADQLGSLAGAARGEYLAWAALITFVAWVALPVVVFPLDENLARWTRTSPPTSSPPCPSRARVSWPGSSPPA